MSVSVLIPVYDAAPFVAETVRSALAQTHGALRVLVAVEPGGPEAPHEPAASLAALAPFAADPRLTVTVNPQRLGWTGNINGLLRSVETPFFAILPHDDLWHPRYLETLLGELAAVPDASCAYCDIRMVRPRRAWRVGLKIRRETDRAGQLFDFFMEGPRGMPWRGLTRTATLAATGGFRDADGLGIIAETEYACRLVAAGPVLHHRAVLFVKRAQAGERTTASQDRNRASIDARRAGFATHWTSMRAMAMGELAAQGTGEGDRSLFEALILARGFERRHSVVGDWLSAGERAALEEAAATAVRLGTCSNEGGGAAPRFGADAGRVAAQAHAVLASHCGAAGEVEAEARHAEAAVALAPQDPRACLAAGRALARQGRTLEAVEVLERGREQNADPRQLERLLDGLLRPAGAV